MKLLFRIFILFIITQFFAFGFIVFSMDTSLSELVSLNELDTKDIIDDFGLRFYLFYSQLFSVLIPAVVFLLIFHYKNFWNWIKVRMPDDKAFFMYGIMFLILSYPLIQLSAEINKYMPFADWMESEGEMINELMKGILTMNTPMDLVLNILIIGLLPAIGEELFFRAGVQNEFLKHFKNKDVAIIVTAVIFSAFHLQFDGFLPRFFLGLILGYFYYWSGSIWLSVFTHFVNNSLLVISAYAMQDRIEEITSDTGHEIPIYILLMSLVAVFVLRKKLIELYEMKLEKLEGD